MSTAELTTVRYFLAHAKADPDEVIDAWAAAAVEALTETHEPLGYEVEVTPGRDDFARRGEVMIAELGQRDGWPAWSKSVAEGTDFRGDPLYDGIIVPVGEGAVIGRATAAMVGSMLEQEKWCYAYFTGSGDFYPITGLTRCAGNSFVRWATLDYDTSE